MLPCKFKLNMNVVFWQASIDVNVLSFVGQKKGWVAKCANTNCGKTFCFKLRNMLSIKIEQRINLKFLVKLNKAASKSFPTLTKVYGKECMSRAHVFEWYKRFCKGRTDVEGDECSKCPSTSKTTENIQNIEKTIQEDCWISTNSRNGVH